MLRVAFVGDRSPISRSFLHSASSGITNHRSNRIEAMSMNLNSPVMMLPQEVKIPSVPDSEMSSSTAAAEYKRKAGPDALAALCAKKRGTCTGLTIEDKTPPEVSSKCSEELDSPESDEESDIPEDDEPVLDPRLTTGDKVLATVRYTTRPGDFQALHEALVKSCAVGSGLYNRQFKSASGVQKACELTATKKYDFIRVELALHKDGQVLAGAEYLYYKK